MFPQHLRSLALVGSLASAIFAGSLPALADSAPKGPVSQNPALQSLFEAMDTTMESSGGFNVDEGVFTKASDPRCRTVDGSAAVQWLEVHALEILSADENAADELVSPAIGAFRRIVGAGMWTMCDSSPTDTYYDWAITAFRRHSDGYSITFSIVTEN